MISPPESLADIAPNRSRLAEYARRRDRYPRILRIGKSVYAPNGYSGVMASAYIAPRLRDRSGMTLIEVVFALLIVLTVMAALHRGPPPDSSREVMSEARMIRGMMLAALARAEAEQGEAVFYADATRVADVGGRFLAVAGPTGVDSLTATALWHILKRGVQWSSGQATATPFGEPLTDARIPAAVRCGAGGCGLGEREVVTYYVSHRFDGRAVAALTVTPEGSVQLYQRNASSGGWEVAAR